MKRHAGKGRDLLATCEWRGEIKMSRFFDANSYRYNGDSHCRCSAALQL